MGFRSEAEKKPKRYTPSISARSRKDLNEGTRISPGRNSLPGFLSAEALNRSGRSRSVRMSGLEDVSRPHFPGLLSCENGAWPRIYAI